MIKGMRQSASNLPPNPRRNRRMPLVHVVTHAQRLLQVAAGETGQSGTVAAVLLAWWNAKAAAVST